MEDISGGVIAVIAVFTLLSITIPGILVMVVSTKGKYYKELPQRVTELEDKDTKNYEEIKRLRAENSLQRKENEQLREQVTGHAELKAIVKALQLHDKEAAGRHTAILEGLDEIFTAIRERAAGGPRAK